MAFNKKCDMISELYVSLCTSIDAKKVNKKCVIGHEGNVLGVKINAKLRLFLTYSKIMR